MGTTPSIHEKIEKIHSTFPIVQKLFIKDIANIIYEYVIDYNIFRNFINRRIRTTNNNINAYFIRNRCNFYGYENKILAELLRIRSSALIISLFKILINEYNFDIHSCYFYSNHIENSMHSQHMYSQHGPLIFTLCQYEQIHNENIVDFLINEHDYNINQIYKKYIISHKLFVPCTILDYIYEQTIKKINFLPCDDLPICAKLEGNKRMEYYANVSIMLRKKGALTISEIFITA